MKLRKDSNEADKQLVAWKAENLWQYEHVVNNMTRFVIGPQ
jgi:hypothetical protein